MKKTYPLALLIPLCLASWAVLLYTFVKWFDYYFLPILAVK